ncbi:hypothetical protein Gorai_007737 [Gossypium raimondii]|uniref:RNase H type-1 domain-containing protein n=1 Tax=Gossypium raimondii TaxID=29730 RepID=A0A7J8Q9L7_GOSRA|nr:hypothetical protein [Gossypium raimondii]
MWQMAVAFDSVKIGGVSRVLMVMPYVLLLSLFRKLKNTVNFKGNEKDPRVIWEIACKLNDNFQIHNLSLRLILPRVPRDCKWETPLEGVSKVNIDVSVKDNKTGLSIILRDSNDFVLCGKASFIDKAANPKLTELDALLVGIRLAQSLNFDKVIFEIDCACIINRLCKQKNDITIFGHHIKEVREMLNSFSKAEVKWVNRGDNKVVDFFVNGHSLIVVTWHLRWIKLISTTLKLLMQFN